MKKILLALSLVCLTLDIQGIDQPSNRIELGQKKAFTRIEKSEPKQKKSSHHKKTKSLTAKKPKLAAKSYYTYDSHPIYYIKDIGSHGNTLSTTDETIWEIDLNSSWIVDRWYPNSEIIITANHRWFSSKDYLLINQRTGERAEADLSQGPFLEYAIFIQYIDPYTGFVQLSDGSSWWLSLYNRIYNWKVGQAILKGENDSWLGRKYILININENMYLPASFSN